MTIYRPNVTAVGDSSDATGVTEGIDFDAGNDPDVVLGTITLPSLPQFNDDPYNLSFAWRINGPGTIYPVHIIGTDAANQVLFEDDLHGRTGLGAGTIIQAGTSPIYDMPTSYNPPVTVRLTWTVELWNGSGQTIYDWWAEATILDITGTAGQTRRRFVDANAH